MQLTAYGEFIIHNSLFTISRASSPCCSGDDSLDQRVRIRAVLEQVIDELLEGAVAQTLPYDFLEKMPPQQLEEALAPITPSSLLLTSPLLLETSKSFERFLYFANS